MKYLKGLKMIYFTIEITIVKITMQYTENYRAIYSLNIEGSNCDNLFKEFKEVFPKRWIISFVSDKSMDYLLDNYGKCHFFRYYERNSDKTIIENPRFHTPLNNRKLEFPLTDDMIDKVLSKEIHIKNLPSEYHKVEAYELFLSKMNTQNQEKESKTVSHMASPVSSPQKMEPVPLSPKVTEQPKSLMSFYKNTHEDISQLNTNFKQVQILLDSKVNKSEIDDIKNLVEELRKKVEKMDTALNSFFAGSGIY